MPKNNINKRMKINYTVFSSVIQMFVCLTLLMMPTVRAEAHNDENLPLPKISVTATEFSPNNDGVQDKISVSYTIPDRTTIAEAAAADGAGEEDVIVNTRYIVESALIFEQNGQSVGKPQTNVREGSGQYFYDWDGEDGGNEELPDGTYKLRLSVTYRHFEGVSENISRSLDLAQLDRFGFGIDSVHKVALKDSVLRYGPGDTVDIVGDEKAEVIEEVKEESVTYRELNDDGKPTGEKLSLMEEELKAGLEIDSVHKVALKGSVLRYEPGDEVDIDSDNETEVIERVDAESVTYRELFPHLTGRGGHTHEKLSNATRDIIIDREPSIIARVQANGNVNLVDGGYIAGSLTTITVTADKGSGTDIDFTAHETAISLTAEDGTELSGATTLQGTTLTLTLGNPLDTRGENGTYTLAYTIVDKAGNAAEGTTTFTYDTVAPTLVSVATSNGNIPPSRGVNGEVTFVEATFEDNLEDGFSRGSSTIRLNAPDDLPVLGRQLSPEEDKIRLEFLTPLVSPDGERDGTYTIVIDAVDRAGNRTETQVPFIYDNRAPQLVTLSASEDGEAFSGIQQRLYHSAPLYQIVATFDDGDTGTGVDVENGTTIAFHPVGGTADSDPNIIRDRDNNRVALLLDTPLVSRDGSQDGIYTLKVTVADRIGNTKPEDFQLIYDTQIPTLVSTVPAANETVSSLTQVQVDLKESTSGIDFVQSTFRLIHNDAEVPVNITSNGTETATLTVLAPFAVDGSDDGLYVIEVTPVDRAGNQGAAARREFFLVSQRAPKIRLLRPETSTVNSLTSDAEGLVAVELVDYIGVGIDFDASTLVVKSPGGAPIPRNIAPAPADEENRRLTWRTETVLPDDGSADGEYTITATFVDFNGQRWTEDFTFNVDTQFPRITTVQALTETPMDMGAERIPVITEAFSRIAVGFEEDDIDIGNTAVVLTGPGGTDIAINLNVNVARDTGTRQSTVNLNFPKLLASGDYALSITPQDYFGNVSPRPFVYRFRLNVDTELPAITSVFALTTPPTVIGSERIPVIEEGFSHITVTFEETAGNAPTPLDIDIGNTDVSLTGPGDADIAINVTHDGNNSLTLNFSRLTASGNYSLSVTPQDYAGNVSPRPFVYPFRLDLALPQVSAVEIGGKIGTVVYVNGGATRIVATLADPTGTGLAFGNEGSRISITNADGTEIPGVTTVQGTNQLVWQAIGQPTDGTADGRYTVTVTPIDKAGRQGEVARRQFIYDTQPPQITEASPLSLTQPVTFVRAGFASDTQLQFTVADVGPAGVKMAEQTAQLLGADGTVLSTVVTRNQTDLMFLTLTEPLARDGSADGSYVVSVSLVDRAGNETKADYAVAYDTLVPQVTDVTLNTTEPTPLVATQPTVITELGFSEFDIAFEEATTRVDFANTTITLTGPDDAAIPLTLTPQGKAQVKAAFIAPQALGVYTLSITPQDIAGNVARGAVNYRFRLDVNVPSVSSVVIDGKVGGIVYVNGTATGIVATLVDLSGAGIALGEGGSTITVANATGTPVPGETTDNGVDTLTWVPGVLPLDGTADGRYTVTITPRDKAGRQGEPVYRQFVFDTQPPEITAASPMDLSQPVTYLSEFSQISVTVADVGPAEFWVEEQVMTLLDTAGNAVAANLTHNETDRIFLTLPQPLAKDGSEDGEYTVQVTLVDKSGNKYAAEHSIVYDTQAPQLVSTVPADGDILTDDVSQVQATLEDAGGSGIDFAETTFTLVAPGGTSITGALSNDGESELTLNLNPLVEDGRYRIRVEARDRAGNGDELRFERSFLLSRTLPSVVSTEPATAPAEDAFTNERISQIEVTLESADATTEAKHLSTLRLLGPGASVIPGQQQREASRLTYTLARPLAQDGSEDGIYTIEFTPISPSGRSGDVQRLTFTYDTEAPELESEDIQLVVAESGVNNSLTEIRVKLTDNQSGIDWENLDDDWLSLERISPNALNGEKTISGKVEDASQDTLRFRLASPLADDGSNDGQYRITVSPKDRAGNGSEPYEKVFTYDTAPPVIDDSTLLINDAPLLVDANALDYPTAVSTTGGVIIQANMFDNGLGVNLAQSRIVVRAPDGAQLTGTTQQNGVDTLVFKSAGLNTRGLYQVTVTSVGNDSEFLGFAPQDSITTEFLYETTVPTATITSDGGQKELMDEALPLVGTATDPSGTQRIGDREQQVPASGVWLVEVVGTGPDGQPIEPVPAVDDSNAEEEPWSRWSLDFLPSRSGEYDLDVRVTDNAGNYDVYDIGKYTMSVSLTFRGSTFGWPNPLRISKGDVAFFSFDVNVPMGDTVELTLSIYDWSGDMVLSRTYPDVVSGIRNDQLLKWDLRNQAGNSVARGIYVFRLEAVNATGNRANVVGKVLVVD